MGGGRDDPDLANGAAADSARHGGGHAHRLLPRVPPELRPGRHGPGVPGPDGLPLAAGCAVRLGIHAARGARGQLLRLLHHDLRRDDPLLLRAQHVHALRALRVHHPGHAAAGVAQEGCALHSRGARLHPLFHRLRRLCLRRADRGLPVRKRRLPDRRTGSFRHAEGSHVRGVSGVLLRLRREGGGVSAERLAAPGLRRTHPGHGPAARGGGGQRGRLRGAAHGL